MLKLSLTLAVVMSAGAHGALAMPMPPKPALNSPLEQVRRVCDPYRCWWQPEYYKYNYYSGRSPFYGGYRSWRGRWHHGWWPREKPFLDGLYPD